MGNGQVGSRFMNENVHYNSLNTSRPKDNYISDYFSDCPKMVKRVYFLTGFPQWLSGIVVFYYSLYFTFENLGHLELEV